MDSSDSSSSSDEEWLNLLLLSTQHIPRPRILENHDLNRYSDVEFKSHFRMSKSTFEFIDSLLHEELIRQGPGCPMIPAHQQIMIALWKMATTDSYKAVCERFNVGRGTAVRAVRRVAHGLCKKIRTFIEWPSGESAASVIRGFKENGGFPNVIGVIDGTHIKIKAPNGNPTDYINHKGYHSIELQIVCDHKSLITDCYAGQPGSINDQGVHRLSNVAQYLNEEDKFPGNSHLIGDSAYELHEHLLTPFPDNGNLNLQQVNYNSRHSSTRMVGDKCLGFLKMRMRSLLHCLPMTRVDLMAEYITACCIVHNICVLREDFLNVVVIPRTTQNNVENLGVYRRDQAAAVAKRNKITQMLCL